MESISKKDLKIFSAEVKLLQHFFNMVKLKKELCLECGGCVALCQSDALELFSNGLLIKKELCVLCDKCVKFCPMGALEQDEKR